MNIKKSLRSKIVFNKKIAIRLTKSDYYRVLGEDIRNLPSRDKEKKKYSTSKSEKVSRLIEHYKTLLEEKSKGTFHVLKGMYNTNKSAAENKGKPPVHTNIVSLVASIPALIVAYRQIRKNKGACTLGAMLSFHKARTLNPFQRRLISSTATSPDGISYQLFKDVSELLKQGKYPWGASRRLYIEKPGQPGSLRPITIPPFMDRVVQTSILKVLECIYEPWFEIQNRSFGFRSRKGVHDAIYALTRRENKGLFTAIEGDIKGAYNNVNRQKLIQILSKRINDRKFLNLMEDRLDYQFLDTTTDKYVEEGKGIPQGGIDSPYLWNIYMSEFDDHIQSYINETLDSLNEKVRGTAKGKKVTKQLANLLTKRRSLKRELNTIQKIKTLEKFQVFSKGNQKFKFIEKHFKEKEKLIPTVKGLTYQPEKRYDLLKQIRRLGHDQRHLPGSDPNKRKLRFIYIRYADDWIILGNFTLLLAEKIKAYIKDWLWENLEAQLAEDKTLITDIRKPNNPAHFLGFEIKSWNTRALSYKVSDSSGKPILTRTAGSEVKAYPDRQRLISRLHMKGYCNKKGEPRPMSWISTLETFALISRFNSVLLGLGNFYYGFVPKSLLNRWIYIIRYCLLKTLAQKYNTNIKGIFKRFGVKCETGSTIAFTVRHVFSNPSKKTMEKTWRLLTEWDLQGKCLENHRFDEVEANFKKIEYDRKIPQYGEYKGKEKEGPQSISIKDDDWVNNVMWVNLRTQASLDLPCSRCGSIKNVQMHHVKHIRKVLYSKIPVNKPHLNIMALRNRKQIPVCRECHLNVIHRGTYNGANLRTLIYPGIHTKKGYDNRLINIESYINRSSEEFYGATLEEKGWKYSETNEHEKEQE